MFVDSDDYIEKIVCLVYINTLRKIILMFVFFIGQNI